MSRQSDSPSRWPGDAATTRPVVPDASQPLTKPVWRANLAFTMALLVQVGDAALTYRGLQHGFHEGNPFIVSLIGAFGVAPALVFGKGYAALGLWLVYRVHWSGLLWGCTAFTFCSGVVPWCLLLLG